MCNSNLVSSLRHSSFGIRHSGAATALAILLTLTSAPAADWPQFLGPERNGIAGPGETVVAGFPPDGPKILWTHPLGSGFAGPAVADGKVVVVHRVEDQVIVQALDAKTGNEIWRFARETKYADSMGFDNGPRACPTIAQGKVIVHGADGFIYALDFADGKLLWTYDTVKEAGSPQGFFGRATAPLMVGDKVVLMSGGKNSKGPAGLIALNLADGKLAWQSVSDEASYASPMFWDPAQPTMLVCWMRNQLVFCDATTGKQIAATRLRSEMGASVNAAQPVRCGDGLLFTSAEYGVGATLWKSSDGKFARVWHKDDALNCHYSTPIYHDGYIYGFHGRQEFGQTLRCIRVHDGRVMWESGHLEGGTLSLVNNTLLVLTEAGELWLVDATPEKFSRRAEGQILKAGHRSYGAFSNGIYYARDGKHLVAVDLHGD
jgi:outer membrane protein assembly factor BamB